MASEIIHYGMQDDHIEATLLQDIAAAKPMVMDQQLSPSFIHEKNYETDPSERCDVPRISTIRSHSENILPTSVTGLDDSDFEINSNTDQSDHGSDYEDNENVEESESDHGEIERENGELVHRTRTQKKRKPEQTEWNREKSNLKRMKGDEYLGYTRTRDGKVFHNKIREPKKLGPSCTSSKCIKYKNRFCNSIDFDTRNSIFQKFWKELDWDQKKKLCNEFNEEKKNTGRKFVSGDSRRAFTYEYFLRVDNETKQVCKKMFLSTLGLKEWMVTKWCSDNTDGMHSPKVVVNATRKLERPLPRSVPAAEQQKEFLRLFLESLLKIPSHYCRRDSQKLYLKTDFGSKANIHRLYTKHCKENHKQALCMFTFWEIFEGMNLAPFSPKKDQCNTCVAYSAALEIWMRMHIENTWT